MTKWATRRRQAASEANVQSRNGRATRSLLAAVSVAAAAVVSTWAAYTPALAGTVDCSQRRGTLGVSRVIEIDATGGPRLGNMQYKDIDFLKPGEVVLTFDDGPLRRYTLPVLNALERHCTKATFFMVGRMAVSDPDMVKEIARRGHTVGTHTWSHKNLGRQSRAVAEREIELGISAISAALEAPAAPFFRFPYLSDPKSMIAHLQERDTAIFSIDVDSHDFRTRSGDRMISNIMNGLKRQGKGILLFHDIQKSTAAGIEDLLDRLYREGYKIVHVVPKAPTTTLSSYDNDGMKELIARKKSAASRPLASRSVVWPISLAGLPEPEPLRALPPAMGINGPVAPATAKLPARRPDTAPDVPPPQRNTSAEPDAIVAPATTYQSAPRPNLRPSISAARPKPDWREEIFRN